MRDATGKRIIQIIETTDADKRKKEADAMAKAAAIASMSNARRTIAWTKPEKKV